jgi:hypothetical protein
MATKLRCKSQLRASEGRAAGPRTVRQGRAGRRRRAVLADLQPGLKNPNAKAGLEHADPKDLIASMRSHETEVMRLLGEIEALVTEVQA